MKSSAILMTEGSIRKNLLRFALPIFLGNLFQQLYNIVDTLVIGNVEGKTALAAIGSTGSLIFLLIGFFGGLFMGVGVTISKYFGAGDHEKMKTSISTALAFGFVAGHYIYTRSLRTHKYSRKRYGRSHHLCTNIFYGYHLPCFIQYSRWYLPSCWR
jgi:Na+-driven multidrug efflux pump